MFKFNFSQVLDYPIDNEDEESLEGHESIRIEHDDLDEPQQQQSAVCVEVPLEELLKTLSSTITYTPLIVNTTSPNADQQQRSIIIPRRDLYDARFQIISEDAQLTDSEDDENAMEIVTETTTKDPAYIPLPDDTTPNDNKEEKDKDAARDRRPTGHNRLVAPALRLQQLDYIDAPSDVIPNVYEGGLKTWECSIDLVQYLSSSSAAAAAEQSFRAKAILEVGCGTAIPTAYILRSLFDEEVPSTASTSRTLLHLQDYNKSVLELVTVPNLLLAWYSSKASSQYRESHSLPDTDPTAPAELSIDTQLVEAFRASLHQHNIQLKFSAGSWSTFDPRQHQQQRSDPPYDIVLTSETIYRSASVPALLSVLHSAVVREAQQRQQQQQQQQWSGLLSSFPIFGSRMLEDTQSSLILVAAKVLYFGVGGSVDEFEAMAKASRAVITTVQETNVGVGRRIMKLRFL